MICAKKRKKRVVEKNANIRFLGPVSALISIPPASGSPGNMQPKSNLGGKWPR
jgi:hypothetical protein